ncbi:hypothetical protein BD560DRAFT_451514 [Blakeslea trispora]|nr:hypothetical protein BD560DRAFT_451514 [Blakeslea trispora]
MYRIPLQRARFAATTPMVRPINARRTMATQSNGEGRTGPSKKFVFALLAAAGGLAYYQRSKDEMKFYNGDSDAHETKEKIAELGNRVIQDGQVREDLRDAKYHLKESANSTGDAARDAYGKIKEEGREATEQLKAQANHAANKAEDKFRDAKDQLKDSKDRLKSEYNPMVNEKVHLGKTKSDEEAKLERYSEHGVRDTTALVSKDTDKIKPVWEDQAAKERANVIVPHEEVSNNNHGGFFGGMFGSGKASDASTNNNNNNNNVVHNERMPTTIYDDAKHFAKDTKHEADHKISQLSRKASETASDVRHEAEYEKEKMKHKLEEDKAKAGSLWQGLKEKAGMTAKSTEEEASRMKHEADRTIEEKTGQFQSGWNKMKGEAQSVVQGAQETASQTADRLKSEANKAAYRADSETERLKRDAKGRLEDSKDYVSESMSQLGREASNQAEKVKQETEQTAKSWYAKGAEQVKSGVSTVKEVADQDIQWAEGKLQDAKEEVSRLLHPERTKEEGLAGHVKRGERFAEVEEGQLRPARPNTDLKPAEQVVEDATGKQM